MATDKEILLKLQLDTKSAAAALKSTDVEIKKTIQSFKKLTKGSLDYQKAQAKLANQQAKYAQQSLKYTQALNAQNKAQTQFTQGMNGAASGTSNMAKSSGAATSSVLEMGRVIQDSNYGIRGMANNITQLASQLVFTAKSAGGLKGAFKSITSALLGPAGLLLIISAVVAMMENLGDGVKSVSKLMVDFAKQSITENVAKLTLLKNMVEDTTVSFEDKAEAVGRANEEFEDLNITLEDTEESIDAASKALGVFVQRMKDVAFAKAILSVIEKRFKKVVEAIADQSTMSKIQKSLSSFKNFGETFKALFSAGGFDAAAQTANINYVGELNEGIDDLYKLLLTEPEGGETNTLMALLFGKEKTGGSSSRKKSIALFKRDMLDLQKFMITQDKNAEKIAERRAEESLLINQKFEKEELKQIKKSFIRKEKERRKNAEKALDKKLKDGVIDQKTWHKAQNQIQRVFDKEMLQARAEHKEAEMHLEKKQAAELDKFREDRRRKEQASALARRQRLLKNQQDIFAVDTTAGKGMGSVDSVGAENAEANIEKQKALMAEEEAIFNLAQQEKRRRMKDNSATNAEIEAELSADRMLFLKSQADQEVELEKMKIDAKRNINQEYIDWASGLSSIMKNLAGENEAIAKAALVLEKGSAIAGIVVQTQADNAKITSSALAEAAGYSAAASKHAALGNAAGAALFTKMAVKAKVTGVARVTKNNVGAGLRIANILATSLGSAKNSSGAGGGGGSEGGGGGRTFDFNLVGSTRQDQLAQSIGGKFDEPVRAYVVGNDISSRQELDNKIKTTATI